MKGIWPKLLYHNLYNYFHSKNMMNCITFLSSTKRKDVLRFWKFLHAVFIEKKRSHHFFSGYVMYICKMNQSRIALEYHQENSECKWFHLQMMQMISLILRN